MRRRMYKSNDHGMQSLSLQPFHCQVFRISIQFITQKRMPDTCHMHTDLMSPSGLQLKLHISVFCKSLKYLIMCNGRFSIFLIDCHLLTLCRMPTYGTLNDTFIFFYNTTDNAAMIAMVAKLKYERGEFTDIRTTATAKYDL